MSSSSQMGNAARITIVNVGYRSANCWVVSAGGCAMAGMVAVFAEFEREILHERVRGVARAREGGHPQGAPETASLEADEIRRHRGRSVLQVVRRLISPPVAGWAVSAEPEVANFRGDEPRVNAVRPVRLRRGELRLA